MEGHFCTDAMSRAFFSSAAISSASKLAQTWTFALMAKDHISTKKRRKGGRLTVLFELGLVHLELQPGPVNDLVSEDGTEEDLGERATKGSEGRKL